MLYVREFCATVVPDVSPCLVKCHPLNDKPTNECFSLIPEYVATNGGSQVIGWAIWEFSGVFIEAEFHAVWCSPTGKLVDIVPRVKSFKEILFLPDSSRKYEHRQVDNIRKQLVEDNDVKRFLFLFHRQFQILNAGERAYQRGVISLPKATAREIESIRKDLARLQQRINNRYFLG